MSVQRKKPNKQGHGDVILICPTSTQPRFHKRATQLASITGIKVFAFSRSYYRENTFPADIPFVHLGQTRDGNYFRRIFSVFAAVLKIRKHLAGQRNCVFYAMSIDCMLIARLCGLKQGYYEIGDLCTVDGRGRIFAFLERLLLKRARGLILTSKHFYEKFFKGMPFIDGEKVHVIDNKIAPQLAPFRPQIKSTSSKRIVIGLIGLLRYNRPLRLLLNFVRERPTDYVIECYGDGPLRNLVESYTSENIRYHGSFKSPDDLPDMYQRVDLNYVVYDAKLKNERLAIPNKLFESAFFGVPIVCCSDTAVGQTAEAWEIGKMLRIDTDANFEKDLSEIDREWIESRAKNCLAIPTSELLDDGEKVLKNMFTSASKAQHQLVLSGEHKDTAKTR